MGTSSSAASRPTTTTKSSTASPTTTVNTTPSTAPVKSSATTPPTTPPSSPSRANRWTKPDSGVRLVEETGHVVFASAFPSDVFFHPLKDESTLCLVLYEVEHHRGELRLCPVFDLLAGVLDCIGHDGLVVLI
ncbi:hypothetical protein HFX_0486 [Haloferax mediterranei ATCC 33500]|uniref:Uncharacterized protein n=1 Tax=Haloferax mediterranei (strain ATCC 33500 / DSM 1411 / JCM 8866 / NBRC 14739 / NCIMB 2177 / R-4) TaxID=523841 RepID=I3R1V8_HALMT|nr:hypothetical protein HFX_0486 [Haloferax mediterranei ATCC 33500]